MEKASKSRQQKCLKYSTKRREQLYCSLPGGRFRQRTIVGCLWFLGYSCGARQFQLAFSTAMPRCISRLVYIHKGGTGHHVLTGVHMNGIDWTTAGACTAECAVFIRLCVRTRRRCQRCCGDHTAEPSADAFFRDEMLRETECTETCCKGHMSFRPTACEHRLSQHKPIRVAIGAKIRMPGRDHGFIPFLAQPSSQLFADLHQKVLTFRAAVEPCLRRGF